MHCNHPLTDYITSLIGDEFKQNATALENTPRNIRMMTQF